jgi:NAD(P)H-flavin reductase
LVKKYLSIVTRVEIPLPDIYTVYFESTEKQFKYRPGQFLHLTLSEYDPSLQWPESRCFSMHSSPNEKYIKITYSVNGKYSKRIAEEIKVGKKIWLKLPYGDIFDRNHSTDNCVFIAGGTGVTPFLSLFNDPVFNTYKNPILYLGFREEKYNIFNQELNKAKEINKSFTFSLIYQNKDGMINIESIYNSHPDTTFFISGPPVMIKLFRNFLIQNSMTENRIITDEWE